MTIIRLYYTTGTMFILLTIILAIFSMLNLENIIVFGLAGLLLFALGLVQHLILLNDKLQQLKTLQTNTNPHHTT
jgi:uncharacterized membrane protein